MDINTRYGSPYDRGRSDSYYGRGREPHYLKNDINNYATFNSELVTEDRMTKQQIFEYNLGYNDNSVFKDWE